MAACTVYATVIIFIFDKMLSFIPHLQNLRTKCTKSLNLLKVVSHRDWGGDSQTLLKLYRTLIRSKLDYGSIVYGSVRKSYLQNADVRSNPKFVVTTLPRSF